MIIWVASGPKTDAAFDIRYERCIQRMWSALEKRCKSGNAKEAEYLKCRAEEGEIESMIVLAGFYEHGVGVEKDISRAAELYRQASCAICNRSREQRRDGSKRTWTMLELANPLMIKAASLGDDLALGQCYAFGYPFERDEERSRLHYKRAAEKGDPEAMLLLGQSYSRSLGKSAPADPELGKKFLELAAENGHPSALQNVIYDSKDSAERVKWLKLLAQKCECGLRSDLGHEYDICYCSNYVYELAARYEKGDGVPQDDHMAVKWYEKASELGNTDAIVALARCYEHSKGVALDDAQAVSLYRKAADLGSGKAMFALGLICERKGLKEDMAAWFCKGARRWSMPAKSRFAECLAHGIGVRKDEARAVEIFKEIARYPSSLLSEEDIKIQSGAAYIVASCYKSGTGVELSITRTVDWLKKSAKLGCSEAMFELGLRSERGDGMRKSPKIAVKWYEKAWQLGHHSAFDNLNAIRERAKQKHDKKQAI